VTVTLATTLSFILDALLVDSDDLNSTRGALSHPLSDTLATGTAANQADKMWYDSHSLAATSEDLDLAGSLTDVFGNTVTFVKVKAIIIHNKSTTATENLAVGGAAANQFINWVANASDIVNVGPDGILFLWSPIDGYAVTAGTGDLLKIDAGSDTIAYDIIIIGTSA